MPDATITSTASTFGTITGTFAADQSTVTGTVTGIVAGTLTGSVGVPGPQGPTGSTGATGATGPAGSPGSPGVGVPVGGTAGQFLTKIDGTNYNTDWTTVNLSVYAVKANNLSDLADAGTARTNLGLGSLAVINDAPSNGSQYARKNGAWDVVSASYISSVSSPLSVTTGNLTIDLSAYLTSATAASTYQTLAGMSSYLTTATAASTYYLQTNPSGFQTAANVTTALSPYLLSATAASTYAVIAAGQPTAGTTGQVLTKNSGTNYDSSWATLIPGDRYLTSSTTSNTVSNGNKTFTIGTGLSYTPTQNITISYNASNHMHGEVLTYNSGTGVLTVDINHHTGSGTYTAWVVNVGGVTPATSVAWGAITGTLSSQTDLQSALDLKLAATTAASTYQTLAGMSSYLTTSTAASTYQPLSGMSSYLTTANAATTYATILEPSVDGVLTVEPSGVNGATVNVNQDANNYIHLRSSVGQIVMVYGGATKWFFNDTYLQFPGGTQQTVAYPGSSTFLLKADNLSGLADTAVSRTNLGLGTMAVETASNYLTTATAASTYQTISGMSSYLTTANAASTYQTLSGMSSYLTSATAASTYFTIANAANKADLASPSLTGVPLSPTASPGTNTTQIATTAFVTAAVSASTGATWGSITGTLSSQTDLQSALDAKLSTSTAASTYYPLVGNPSGFLTSAPVTSVAGRTGAITLSNTDISGLGTMSTATAADYSTTTVANGLYYPLSGNPSGFLTSAPVTSVAGRTGAITLAVADVSGAAPLASPSLTGTPLSTTAAVDTNTTQIATTAFVVAQAASATPLVNGTAAVGTSLRYARADHVHGTDTTRAPLASPTFTGTVTIPVGASISGFAPLASPTFTGTPTLPTGTIATTQTLADNSTKLATTAYVDGSIPANNVKAWVNFNGTGTVAIRASMNVSSITDNGAGSYTVNFTTALADANYAVSGSVNDATGGSTYLWLATGSAVASDISRTTSLVRVQAIYGTNSKLDATTVNVVITR